MADIAITAASVAVSSQAVIRKEYSFAVTVTQGQVVYLNSNSQWALCDTDASANGNGLTDLRGIALNSGSVGQPASVCTFDPAFTLGGTVVNGTPYYLSPTAGGITATTPTTANYPVFLGIATGTTKLVLNPTATGVII